MDISVVIPTYNRGKFLKRAILSVQNQTYKPKQIIVIDDGSCDETYKIVKQFLHVKYFYKKNGGVSSARNLGIKNAHSDWIAFLDSDDIWHKEKLATQVLFHTQNPLLHVSYTQEKWIRNDIEVSIPKKFQKYGGFIFDKCLNYCIIAPSSVMVKKEIFEKVGYFDEDLEVCEDYDLWLRISLDNQIGFIDKELIVKYAGHENQLSFKHWGMDRFRIMALEKLYLHVKNEQQKNLIRQTLIEKLNLLIIGAKKHNNQIMLQKYQMALSSYM